MGKLADFDRQMRETPNQSVPPPPAPQPPTLPPYNSDIAVLRGEEDKLVGGSGAQEGPTPHD